MVCLDPGDRDQEGRPERRRPSAWLVEARTAASWLETRELLDLLHTWIEGQDLSAKDVMEIPPGYGSCGLSSRRQTTRIESSYGELNKACH